MRGLRTFDDRKSNAVNEDDKKKHKVPRMDSNNQKTEWYYPFCIKMIICEKSPSGTQS